MFLWFVESLLSTGLQPPKSSAYLIAEHLIICPLLIVNHTLEGEV